MTNPSILTDLQGRARDIAFAPTSPLRVAAGPGTGKTFALMRRIARLLHDGVAPERIFVVTFTRTAARDLVDSLRALGVAGAREVVAGTLHSHCFRVLNREAVLQVTGRVPRPLLQHEVRVALADLQHHGQWGVREAKEMLKGFEAAWARLQHEEPGWPRRPEEQAFQSQLLQWLRLHKGMLIGELVPEFRKYLRDNPACDELRAFRHILVDEYQDLNRADQDVIDRLAAASDLTVIGDEDQAIYTQLRHAQPEGIRNFNVTHPGTEDIPLDECRRCPQTVVHMANALIGNNASRAPRVLLPSTGNPEGTVEILQWPTMEAEARGVAHLIHNAIEAGTVSRGEVLVLTPRRPVGHAIREALEALGTPAHSFFTEQALEAPHAQERFNLLNLLARPHDPVALRTWLAYAHNGFAAAPYAYLRQHCDEQGVPLHVAAEGLRRGTLALRYSTHLQTRLTLLDVERGRLDVLKGQALVDGLFPAGNQDLFMIRALANEALSEVGEDMSAADLYADLLVRIIQPELPESGDFVRIMSLHKSKGLTADMTVVASCLEGWLPSIQDENPTTNELELEEQRRLFYVAVTRSRKVLVLSSFRSMPVGVAHRMQVGIRRVDYGRAQVLASRFLSELGPHAPRAQAVDVGHVLGG